MGLDMYLSKVNAKVKHEDLKYLSLIDSELVNLYQDESTEDRVIYDLIFPTEVKEIAERTKAVQRRLMYEVYTVKELIGRLLSADKEFRGIKGEEVKFWRHHPDLHGFMETLYNKTGETEQFNNKYVLLTKQDCLDIIDLSNRWLRRLAVDGDPVKKEPIKVQGIPEDEIQSFVDKCCRTEAERVESCKIAKSLNPPKEGELVHTDGFFFNVSDIKDWISTIKVFDDLINTFDFEHNTLIYRSNW